MYFSQLDAEVDDAMAAEAAELAREADASDVTTLAAAFERLATQHLQSPLSKDELDVLAARYGSLLGELVRVRAGGAWGIGRLFDEEIRGCLLVGARAIKFWPWLEARDRIEGRVFRFSVHRSLFAHVAPAPIVVLRLENLRLVLVMHVEQQSLYESIPSL